MLWIGLLLSTIKVLATVRRLQSNTPSVQVNTQVNLTGSEEAGRIRREPREGVLH